MIMKHYITILIIAIGIGVAYSLKQNIVMETNTTRPNPTNESCVFTPLTLGCEWPAVARLLLSILSATLGTFYNGFFVASFCCENSLSLVGNVFLACLGITDLMITSCVIPVPGLVISSSVWNTIHLCHTVQVITEATAYCYSLFFMLASFVTYLRFCWKSCIYRKVISYPIGGFSVTIFLICFIAAGAGVYLDYDYDYCLRESSGNLYFRIAMTVVLHVIPFIMGTTFYVSGLLAIIRRANRHIIYKNSVAYQFDRSTTILNIIAFIFFYMMWLPYFIVAFFYPNVSDNVYDKTVWLGISRSVFTSILYSLAHRDIRSAFGRFCKECCCRNALPSSLRNHHRPDDIPQHVRFQVNPRNLRRGDKRCSCLSIELHEF